METLCPKQQCPSMESRFDLILLDRAALIADYISGTYNSISPKS